MIPNPNSSPTTRNLGIVAILGLALVAVLGGFLTEPDDLMGDLVRIMYVHVPVAIMTYTGFVVGAIASGYYLWKRSEFADLVAHAAIEIGVICGVLLILTGAIWGNPTWGTYWSWQDVRLVSTLVLVLLYVGYLAIRQLPVDHHVRARRSAVIAIASTIMIPIVRYSVTWWSNRTLHQEASLTDGKLEDLTLFTLMLGIVVGLVVFAWLTIHRFRVLWLEQQVDNDGLEGAIAERRAEATSGVEAAVTAPGDVS